MEQGYYFVKDTEDSNDWIIAFFHDGSNSFSFGNKGIPTPEIVDPIRIIYPDEREKSIKTFDEIQKPSHYTDSNIEVIDYIEDKKLGFNLGNTVKYISRCGKKEGNSRLKDLQKAKWYLDREVDNESKLPL